MALKPATVGIVLAMALTILTAMTATPPSPIFGPELPLCTKAVDKLCRCGCLSHLQGPLVQFD